MTDAGEDEMLSALIDEFGAEGYGVWVLIRDAIARQVHDDPKASVTYSLKKWSEIAHVSTKKFAKLAEFLAEIPGFLGENEKIIVENLERDGIKFLRIEIPKILELADEYTQKRLAQSAKSGQTPNDVGRKSGERRDKVPHDKIRLDKNRRKDNTKDIDRVMVKYQEKFPEVRKLYGLGGIIRARDYFDGCHDIGWTYESILDVIEKATVSQPWKIITISDKNSKAYAKEWKDMVRRKDDARGGLRRR